MTLVFPSIYVNGLMKGKSFTYKSAVKHTANDLSTATISWVSPTLTISGLAAGTTLGLINGVEPIVGDRLLSIDAANAIEGTGITTGKGASFNGIWSVTGGTTTTLTLTRSGDLKEGDSAMCAAILNSSGEIFTCTTDMIVSSNINLLTFICSSLPSSGTALEVPRGGTGQTSFTTNAIIKGSGTGNLVASGITITTANDITNVASITDGNTNKFINFTSTASAVNQFEVKNAITGANPTLTAVGTDTNVSMSIQAKGSGNILLSGTLIDIINGSIKLTNGAGSVILVSATSGNYSLTMPTSAGTNNCVLSTNGTDTLSWSRNPRDIAILTNEIKIDSTILEDVAYFAWDQSEYSAVVSGKLVVWAAGGGSDAVINLYNDSTSTAIATITATGGGSAAIGTSLITLPTADTLLSLRVKLSAASSTDGHIYSAHIVLE